MEREKIDFKETPLCMTTVKNLPQFLDQLEEAKVMNGIQEEMPTGESLEAKIILARAAITKAEADVKKRGEIETITTTARTEEQKQELKRLASHNPTNALQAAKKEESELEKRLEESRKKIATLREWVHERVDADLFRSFKDRWDATKENTVKQFFEGIKGVVERVKTAAPAAVLQMHRQELNQLNCGAPEITVAGALRKLNKCEELLTRSAKHATIMGMGNLKLSDQEAINVMQFGVTHVQGEGDLTEAIQEKLDAGAGAVMTWKEFSAPLREMLEKKLVTNSLKQQKTDGNMAFKATTSAAVMTSTAAAAAAPQHHGSSAAVLSTTADATGALAQVFTDHLALNTKLLQQLVGKGGGRGGGRGGAGGGRGRGGQGGGNTRGQGTCYAYLRGKCDRGNSCMFQHIKADASNIPDCRDGLKCNNNNCVFNHPANSRPGTPKPGEKRKA